MNYKKIIKSRDLRIKILGLLNWIPAQIMIPLQYWIHTGRILRVKHPKRFTEKLQIYKLKYRDPLMLRCTDKYEVRKVIEDLGGKNYLIPLIGIYNSEEEIKFEQLPDKFVAKTTDGGGGNQVLVCKDKYNLKSSDFYATIGKWLASPKLKPSGREWAYENNYPRRIIIEELIGDGKNELIDYKFFCFNGKVRMVYVVNGRVLGKGAKIGIYTPEFVKLDVRRNDEYNPDPQLPMPTNYNKMIEVAEKLSKDFPHVRVDLYNVNGRIFFGELTFYDGSGYMTFSPDSYDEELGSYFDLQSLRR